jgi:hypothetical protein
MDIVRNAIINFENTELSNICIDNKDIRKKILKSKTLLVKAVPCILILYPDGGVEKYEGGTAFRWVEEIINKKKQQEKTETTTIISNLPDDKKPVKNNDDVKIQINEKKKSNKKVTMIDELPSEDEDIEENIFENHENPVEDDDEQFSQLKPPPSGIRSGVGNYEINEFGEFEEQSREVKRGIKTESGSSTGVKNSSLLATAMAMQKNREKEDSSKIPPHLRHGN